MRHRDATTRCAKKTMIAQWVADATVMSVALVAFAMLFPRGAPTSKLFGSTDRQQ